MRRIPVIAAAILAVTLGVITAPQAHAALTCTGPGTYMINSEAELRALAADTACWATGLVFTQPDNIALTSTWIPIGNETTKFQGTYDGNGKTISGLSIALTSSSLDYAGLFGYTLNATVKNTNLTGVSITNSDTSFTGPQFVGGLIGRAENTDVLNSSVVGSIDATNYVGGVVGEARSGSLINNCTSSGTIGSASSNTGVGGIVGKTDSSDLTNVSSSATVAVNGTNGSGVGGIVGDSYSTNITNATATGSITSGQQRAGGIAGSLYTMSSSATFTISNSQASGNVLLSSVDTNTSHVGGLIGHAWALVRGGTLRIIDSHASGDIKGYGNAGGLIGAVQGAESNAEVTRSFATGDVEGVNRIGGLIGGAERVGITESYATGTTVGTQSVGGLVGSVTVFSSSIVRSFATGSVSGGNRVGGFVGDLDGPSSGTPISVSDSYATGSVFASGTVSGANREAYVGGFAGRTADLISLTNSYSTGAVTATAGSIYIGGLAGNTGASVTAASVYWDSQASGMSAAAGDSTNTGATITGASALTTMQMRSASSFTGWDFSTVWGYQCSSSNYPQLRAINSSATATTCIEPAPTPDPGGGETPTAEPTPIPVTTPTPVTAPTPPSVPAPTTPPASLPPGSVFGTIGGSPIDIQTKPGARGTGLTLQAGPVAISLRGITSNGQRIPLATNGSLILPRSGQIPTGVSGLAPGTSITQVLYSTPVELGTASANSSGTFTSSPTLPATVPTGAHTLSITGTTNTGLPFTVALGVTVATPAVALGANPVVMVKPRKVSSDTSANVMARAVQAGCLVTFVAGDTRTTTQASASGVAQVTIPVHKVRARSWEITTRVTGKGCATITVKTKVPVTRPAN